MKGLKKIFENTKYLVESGIVETSSLSEKFDFNSIIKNERKFKNKIIVEDSDTVSSAIKYSKNKTCILNMASSRRPGGGVESSMGSLNLFI